VYTGLLNFIIDTNTIEWS